jgi:hypothetical protein
MTYGTAQWKLDRIKLGQRVITNDRELDLMAELDGEVMNRVRSIPNPEQCGLLDQYVAWID